MSDIVWRLRNAAIGFGLPNEAADEIERLVVENEVMAKHIEVVQIIQDGCDSERMELRAKNERLTAFIADKIHDASRERMLMEIDYRGSHG